jgi:hypothetical protein
VQAPRPISATIAAVIASFFMLPSCSAVGEPVSPRGGLDVIPDFQTIRYSYRSGPD